ncbi:phosphohydrolase [Marinomonas sp. SBI22]|uniref:HD domain-containing protein n=1 Tax=unclassified Marinomonas TaxID=196814 RepID=UPI0007AEFE0E|nr:MULTISPECIES: HD domain-containing protein [unclassified Marinomonas]KZM40769.1 phosphohydrolase [Marinomonas sp. SBI8L]KZM46047.1 phosphohydrolase [Marinomonas sp. SBI22]
MLSQFEPAFAAFIQAEMQTDLAHDYQHVLRVVKNASKLCQQEGAIEAVVLPAAWLHDCLSLPKDHPQRAQASQLAADKAISFLTSIQYPAEHYQAIHHAICCHSYSANITPSTLEAKIVQDADRLDALGAIGIARCLQVSSQIKRPLYAPDDPFCNTREIDDKTFTLDHFYQKLLKIKNTMHCQSARKEADKRSEYMQGFLEQLQSEISY